MKTRLQNPHSDLAVEAHEQYPNDDVEIHGVVLEESDGQYSDGHISRVIIENRFGSHAMQKPIGSYLTLELPRLPERETLSDYSQELSVLIQELLPKKYEHVMVIGLGNRNMTADALGPLTVDKLTMTSHLENISPALSGIAPGVMAQTGLETASYIHGLCHEVKPDVLIVIDALAARRVNRLTTTIQLSNTGIQPGSGVGNHRKALTEQALGIPVIAIGVPTVVGAVTIAYDTLDALLEVLACAEQERGWSQTIRNFSDEEKLGLLQELIEPRLGPMFVTPKDMDESVELLSELLADAIQRTFPSGNRNN